MQSIRNHYYTVAILWARQILFLLIACCMCVPAFAQDEEGGVVVYTDKVTDCGVCIFPHGATPKGDPKAKHAKEAGRNRVSTPFDTGTVTSRKGMLIAYYRDYSGIVDLCVLQCLKLAMDVWEEALGMTASVRFDVDFTHDMDEDDAIETTVRYVLAGGKSVPRSLYNQMNAAVQDMCASIVVNTDVDWNTSWEYSADGTYSLTNALMRHIAHMLGFGTSVVYRNGALGFAVARTPSAFDLLLSNGTTTLTRTTNLNTFFSQPVCFQTADFTYPLYNTTSFVEGRSAAYFALGWNNLMEHDQEGDNNLHPINSQTLDVLHAIGWDVRSQAVEIVAQGVDSLGVGTIHGQLSFAASSSANALPQDITWRFQRFVPSSQTYRDVITGSGTEFVFTPQVNTTSFDDLSYQQARVVCQTGGREYSKLLLLNPRPCIDAINVYDIVESGNGRYTFTLDISQRGATSGVILITDAAGGYREYSFNGQPIHVAPMWGGYYVDIDIELTNTYGTTYHLAWLPPMTPSSTPDISETTCHITLQGYTLCVKGVDMDVEIYTTYGTFVDSVKDVSEYKKEMAPGLYLIKVMDNVAHRFISKKVVVR